MHIQSSRWAGLILVISVVFGAVLRFMPTIVSGSPINDGGMFYVMIENLEASRFLIPATTSYNNYDIPFAYPPFSFYIGGFLSALHIPVIEIVRWLPPLLSTLSILAFYWMSSLMLGSKNKAVLAVLAYALMPRSYLWYIMGGGLSRAFGLFFLLLTCASVWAMFAKHTPKYILLSALFGAGAVLSHPETGLHAAAACLLIWLFKGRTSRGFRDAVFVALGVLILSSPWWGTVLGQHGLDPFRSALNTGRHSGLFWLSWITFDFAEERFVTLLTVLGLLGLLVHGFRRDWFLPVWMFISFAVEPRSATAIAALPLASMAGTGLADFVLPKAAALTSNSIDAFQEWTDYISKSKTVKVVVGYVLFSAFLGAFFYNFSLVNYAISNESRVAMHWVRDHTPPDGSFIVLTGRADPFADPCVEWFPAIAARRSQNTIQGREWLLAKDFMPFLSGLEKLQSCLNEGWICVEGWAEANQIVFDYVFIEKTKFNQNSGLLLHQLNQNPNYTLIFENSGAAIFSLK